MSLKSRQNLDIELEKLGVYGKMCELFSFYLGQSLVRGGRPHCAPDEARLAR